MCGPYLTVSLLFTPTRRWIQERARKWLEQQVATGRVQVGVIGTDRLGNRAPGRDPRSGGPLDPRNEIEQRPRD